MTTDRISLPPVLSLEKKFAAYALVGGAAVLGLQDCADASIVTGTVNQTIGPSSNANVVIDLDNDGLNDLTFSLSTSTTLPASNGFVFQLAKGSALAQSGGATMNSGALSKDLATVLPSNTLVGSTAAGGSFWQSSNPSNGNKVTIGLQDYDATTNAPIATNSFAGETQKFIGLAIVLSSESTGSAAAPYPVHYGWVRLSAPSTWGGNLTIHDWAYESQPGVGIRTGGTVPEPGTLQVVALGGLGLVAWRRRRLQAAE